MQPSEDESSANDGLKATVLSKKRRDEKINELRQRTMILEQDEVQVRENATA